MQRLSGWLESLPRLKRRARGRAAVADKGARGRGSDLLCGRRRKRSLEARPSETLVSQPYDWQMTTSAYEQRPLDLSLSCHRQEMMTTSTGSLSRPGIRTNPWCSATRNTDSRSRLAIPHLHLWGADGGGITTLPSRGKSASRASLPRTSAALNTSLSSSGYASNDSSPASSLHTPDWTTPPPKELDKSCAELRSMSPDDEDDGTPTCDLCQAGLGDHAIDANGNPRCPRPRLFIPPPPPFPPSSSSGLAALEAGLARLSASGLRLGAAVEAAKAERSRRLRDQRLCKDSAASLHSFSRLLSRRFEMAL